MARLLVTDSLHEAGWDLLRAAGHEVEQLDPERRADLPAIAAGFDGLLIRTRTRVTSELLRAAPRVRVVGRAGAGLDNVDREAARELGVAVVSAPEANAPAAAEHTFGLLLAVARSIPSADADLKAGRWNPDRPLGFELAGRSLGVVGFGRIGQRVAARARAFDMEVLVNDPVIDDAAVERIGVVVERDLADLLRRAHVVTVHTPLDDTTRGLLGADELALLPEGALVLNCARGGIVDEGALLAALESGRVAGAGLDVFEAEPPVDFTLAAHPRVVATPHWGAHTAEAKRRVAVEVCANVVAVLRGRSGSRGGTRSSVRA